MARSFDRVINSRFYKLGEAVGNVVIISALFILFCLPVLTIGASLTALYYTVWKKYDQDSDSPYKDFMRAFKASLKEGIIIHLIYSLYTAVVVFNIYFAFNGLGDIRLPDWYLLISLVPIFPVLFSMPFVFPLLARFDNNIRGTITNSFTLCMINFPKFFLIWIIVIVSLAVCIFFPPALFAVPTGAMYLTQQITEKAIKAAVSVERSRQENAEEDTLEDVDDGQ